MRLAEDGVAVSHRDLPRADHYFLTPGNARSEMGRMAAVLGEHLS